MKNLLFSLATALLLVILPNAASAQAFVNDNDGRLDVGEAPGFPVFPAAVTGTLSFSNKGIEDLDGASLLTNLQELRLVHNSIASIESGDFNGLANLQTLYLSGNRIGSIESSDFSGLANLQKLGLYGNNIASIESGDFSELPNLQSLDLSNNYVTSIELGAFSGLANLQTLVLAYNGIARIEPWAFAGMKELQTLILGGSFTVLDFTGATFDNLQPLSTLNDTISGFAFLPNSSNRIMSLILDDALN